MKKLFAILAVAGFVACNNNGENQKTEGGDTAAKTETTTPAAPDTTAPAAPDTTAASADTSAAK